MSGGDDEQDGTNSDENGQENRNLVNLINKDLHEDEASDDDEVIFDNKNVHLDLDIGEAKNDDDEDDKLVEYPISVKDESDKESSDNITDISDSVNSSGKDKESRKQKNNGRDSSNDSLSDLTDTSEKLDDDDENGTGIISNIPNINILRNTDTTSDSSDSDRRKKRKKSPEELLLKARLDEEIRNCEVLRGQLRDERDAKERLESNLYELQRRLDGQLKEEEELRHQIHKKDELNSMMEKKELGLMQELVEAKRKLSDNLENSYIQSNQRENSSTSYPDTELQSINEKLIIDVNELQCKLEASETLLDERNLHLECLNRKMEEVSEELSYVRRSGCNNMDEDEDEVQLLKDEVRELKRKLSRFEEDGVEVKPVMDVPLAVADQLSDKIKTMVENVIGDSHKRLRIKDLEDEVRRLKEQLDESKDKYSVNLAEALSTLKQVQDAYGEMRDVVLEGYKQEIASLHDRVRIAEEKSNEDIITGLRQELLDARLQQERSKQAFKDDMEVQQKRYDEREAKINELLNDIEKLKQELHSKGEDNKAVQDSLQKTIQTADDRKHTIEELNNQLSCVGGLRDTIKEKEELINELKTQLLKEAEMLTKEHAEKEALQLEVELMESIKRQNQRLEEEIEEMNHKVKLRGTKIRFLKKHVKELEEQKQKAEALMLVIPEMQKKIDELTEEKEKLKQDIIDKEKLEEETKRRIEEEKKEEEERIQKEKENWEKRILGIGKCMEFHEEGKEQNESNGIFNRPNSAPLLKPRPPTAKRTPSKNHTKTSPFRAPTLNPDFLNSYPEGRKATQKMKLHQEKIILSSQNRDNLFRSVTKPMSYHNASFKHISDGKYFPKISPRSKDNLSAPRVLVWGNNDGPGSKMVAVGDLVLTKINSECSVHGHCSKQQPGIVKFIGFVDGNDDDVYIGLRLEEEVGYTDGMIQGKRYFRSEPEKGAFVHLDDIVEVLQSQTKHVPTLTM